MRRAFLLVAAVSLVALSVVTDAQLRRIRARPVQSQASDFGGYRSHYQGPGYNSNGGNGGTLVCRVNTLTVAGTPTWGTTGDINDCLEGVPAGCTVGSETIGSCGRYVVFEVCCTIDATGRTFDILADYITVAGQTAPTGSEGSCSANCSSPGGILIRNGAIHVKASHVVLQHLRVRCGTSYTLQGITVGDFADSAIVPTFVVLDHISLSWCGLAGTSNWGFDGEADETQVVDSFIAEPLYPGGGYGLHLGGGDPVFALTQIASIRNLMAHQWFRNPWFAPKLEVHVINNYAYNADIDGGFVQFVQYSAGGYTPGNTYATVAYNIFDRGPNSGSLAEFIEITFDAAQDAFVNEFYLIGNSGTAAGVTGPTVAEQWAGGVNYDGYEDPGPSVANEAGTRVDAAPSYYTSVGYALIPQGSLAASVRGNAGAFPLDRDAVDTRIASDTTDLDGTNEIADEDDVGGYPTLQTATRTLTLPASPAAAGSCGGSRSDMVCSLEQSSVHGSRRIEVSQGVP